MLKCKNCGAKLNKFQRERCPYCGEYHPIDGMKDASDTTQFIDKIYSENLSFKEKNRKYFVFLCMFLGLFSADLFYINKIKTAFIRLLFNITFFLIIFIIIYLINPALLILAILLPLGILFITYLVIGIFYLIKRQKPIDGNGAILK